jgi:hypothetical protein
VIAEKGLISMVAMQNEVSAVLYCSLFNAAMQQYNLIASC